MWIDERVLQKCETSVHAWVWVPKAPCVVLGNANRSELECHVQNCQDDKVPILKRAGGGGAVVLHPGCVVVSLGLWVHHYYRNAEFFHSINSAVIKTLQNRFSELTGLEQDGFSDITLQGRKVAGTSLFRSRNYLLYQASILVDTKLSLIERYLAHPSREPVYRQGKSHGEFLTCLSKHLPNSDIQDVHSALKAEIEGNVREGLSGELCEPQPAQVEYLRKRFAASSDSLNREESLGAFADTW